jgi:hypothetical protein
MNIKSRVAFLNQLALPLAFSFGNDVIVVDDVIDVVVVIVVVYRNDKIVIYIVNIVNQAVW